MKSSSSIQKRSSVKKYSKTSIHNTDNEYSTLLFATIFSFVVGVAFGPKILGVDKIELIKNLLLSYPVTSSLDQIYKNLMYQNTNDIQSEKITERHVIYKRPKLQELYNPNNYSIPYEMSIRGGPNDPYHNLNLPSADHIIVDLQNLDPYFLRNEKQLINAMKDVIQVSNIPLLSYQCHEHESLGFSCAAILIESYLTFFTWPQEGSMILDFYTCGKESLISIVLDIERAFAISKSDEDNNIQVILNWAYETRGFKKKDKKFKNVIDNSNDLESSLLSSLDTTKYKVLSVETPYQKIDIWDTIDADDFPTYQDALEAGLEQGDPRWLSNEVSKPQRDLFLNGIHQMDEFYEHEYYEALVHPAMFAHPNPVNVLIIGGGKGAALREVLKHETVQSVTVLEVDKVIIEITQKYLKFLMDCSDIVGSTDNCYDDPRATVIHADTKEWFSTQAPLNQFDVILIDPIDHGYMSDITDPLFSTQDFLTNVYDSLTKYGTLAIQIGVAPSLHDPRPDIGIYFNQETIINTLETHNETSVVLIFEEAHNGNEEPTAFLVSCKHSSCRKRWYTNTDTLDYEIHHRIKSTKSNDPALFHYDGGTQFTYQNVGRAWETVYCRREPMPFECAYRGLDLQKDIFEFDLEENQDSNFEIQKNNEVSSIYTLRYIPQGSYIMPTAFAASFIVNDISRENIQQNINKIGTIEQTIFHDFLTYADIYGHKSMAPGIGQTFVESSLTSLMKLTNDKKLSNVGPWMPPHPSGNIPPYSPVYERHMHSFDVFMIATSDINKGEELVRFKGEWDMYL